MPGTYKAEGIVIKRYNFGECDKIITIFTKQYGKIKCIAKGIRKLTSRKGGNLELFNLVSLFLIKGKNLDIVTEVKLINAFVFFRKDIKKTALAFQLSELIDRFTQEKQINNQLFDLLVKSLIKLTWSNININNLLLEFKVGILQSTGFGLPEKINKNSLDRHIENIIEKRVKSFYE